MDYDIIFVTGEIYFDHPLCGFAILKRLLEKNGYSVGIIEMPQKDADVLKLGKPKLFFGVSSGSIDSMVRNYTPLKKKRSEDSNLDYKESGDSVPDRAVIVYSNWIRQHYKDSLIILGGIEASVRRFTHYDYWDNKLRKPILLDSRADILAFGAAEKQILEIAAAVKAGKSLDGIFGTCVLRRELPSGFEELPSHSEVVGSKEKFVDMHNMLSPSKNQAQKVDTRFVLQYKSPKYTSADLDSYYELPFTRTVPSKHLRGFEFSVVTHRGCVGGCNFCSLKLTQGDRVVSRSEESILREIEKMTAMPHFKGNVDDMGGPSANMYGMDCDLCADKKCLECSKLDRTNKRLLALLRKARSVKGVKNVYIRSGVRYDIASPEYIKELVEHHIYDTLRVAPEHVNPEVLRLMNKQQGSFAKFLDDFEKLKTTKKKSLSYYFITAHPGSSMKEATELAEALRGLTDEESVQVFTPTPMTMSTCMYYTGMDPKTKKPIYVPYTYAEKKKQKSIVGEGKRKV